MVHNLFIKPKWSRSKKTLYLIAGQVDARNGTRQSVIIHSFALSTAHSDSIAADHDARVCLNITQLDIAV